MNRLPTTQNTIDNLYMGVDILSDELQGSVAEVDFNKVRTILGKPSDFYIYINDFRVPSAALPILEFRSDFTFQISYNGTTITKPVVYIQPSTDIAEQFVEPVYQYSNLIRSFNIALEEAFIDLQLAEPGIPATLPPKIVYNRVTQLLELYVEVQYESNLPNPIVIGMSVATQERLSAFNVFQQPGLIFTFIITNDITNQVIYKGVPAYKMTGNFQNISDWNDFSSIAFETSHIPVDTTLIGDRQDIQRSIVEDFNIVDSVEINDDIIFRPIGPLRPKALISNFPWSRIDLNVVYFNPESKTTDSVLLVKDNSALITLGFRRRTTDMLMELDESSLNDP